MDRREVEIARFEETIARLRQEFPSLTVTRERLDDYLDAEAVVPAQVGLDFDVSINLQNFDELYLVAGHFRFVWFPRGDQQVFDRYLDAVTGLISGRFRIVESFVFGQPCKARLQKPVGKEWETVATWSDLSCLIPWRRTRRVIQNTQDPHAATRLQPLRQGDG